MGIPLNIDDLINRRVVESSRIEFKSDWNPNAVIHTICAFANDIDNLGGGYIVIGVDELDGSPIFPIKGVEQKNIDNILKELVGFCHFIEPLYNPVVEPIIYQDKYVIVIWATGGYGRPYKASKDVFLEKSNKLYYIRKFNSTIVASPNEEKELFYISSDIPFDDRPNLLTKVSDLDLQLMRQHLNEIGSNLYEFSLNKSVEELALDLQIISGPPEDLRPLNVGILMFTENPQKFFRYARIEVVDIPDPTGSGMVEKVFTGPIQRQLKDALLFLKNYLIKEIVIKEDDKPEAIRVFNYPFRAIEEILGNAVYHRSYQINEPITVKITPTEIEITSFPGFDRSISNEDISNYTIRSKRYRNRRIGDFLKELRLIEGRNTGFPNTYKALEKNGSSYPIFVMDENREYLSVIIPIHPYFLPKERRNAKSITYEKGIIEILRERPMGLNDLAKELGYKGISKKLSKRVNELIDAGILKRVAKEGSNYSVLAYVKRENKEK